MHTRLKEKGVHQIIFWIVRYVLGPKNKTCEGFTHRDCRLRAHVMIQRSIILLYKVRNRQARIISRVDRSRPLKSRKTFQPLPVIGARYISLLSALKSNCENQHLHVLFYFFKSLSLSATFFHGRVCWRMLHNSGSKGLDNRYVKPKDDDTATRKHTTKGNNQN